jgi:endonuclease G
LNAGPWARLEEAVRSYVRQWETVWVVTGPLYESPMPALPGANEPHVVPSGYWKIIADWDGGDVSVAAFIMQQDVDRSADVASFTVSVAEVEARSGLTFFPELSVADQAGLKALSNANWFLE